MGTWVGRFIQIDDSVLEILFEVPFERCRTCGYWCVMCGEDVHFMVIFEEQRPLFCLDVRSFLSGFD